MYQPPPGILISCAVNFMPVHQREKRTMGTPLPEFGPTFRLNTQCRLHAVEDSMTTFQRDFIREIFVYAGHMTRIERFAGECHVSIEVITNFLDSEITDIEFRIVSLRLFGNHIPRERPAGFQFPRKRAQRVRRQIPGVFSTFRAD